MPPRRRLLALPVMFVIAVMAAPGVAGAAPSVQCKSADLRYPFQPGGPKTFGVFKLRIAGGSCATAHRVAKEWMNTDAAQTFNERGRKGTTTIRFDSRVPNG